MRCSLFPPGQLVIDSKYLQYEKVLGSGNFGEVWKATYKGSIEVAVKKTIKGAVNDHEFMQEAKTMM